MRIARRDCPLLSGVPDESYFYFVHSYYAEFGQDTLGVTDYGIEFAAMMWKENVYAAQFHPEKSQQVGLTILKNFLDL
jgi:glutamine amidotransferase